MTIDSSNALPGDEVVPFVNICSLWLWGSAVRGWLSAEAGPGKFSDLGELREDYRIES
ncbi:hypothetical protein [Prescottella sp. R16]|uniref:hypothetical protein n=1 Tax=Prescottella sp. R16 TaxID=3064529 RepID=UPI00272EB5C8|nr:hypothetical protein [Prescottella sp. R16]